MPPSPVALSAGSFVLPLIGLLLATAGAAGDWYAYSSSGGYTVAYAPLYQSDILPPRAVVQHVRPILPWLLHTRRWLRS